MNEITNQPLVLKKKSRSSGRAKWSSEGNSFNAKLLRVCYIFVLFALDFIMFIYSINGKLIENGQINKAVLVIFGGVFVISFVLIFLLAFSKNMQNMVCGLFTAIMIVLFFNQFALFNVDNFLEIWLSKKANWLTFFCVLPSSWMIGALCGILIFFAFRFTQAIFFVTVILFSVGIIGVKKTEFVHAPNNNYVEIKSMPPLKSSERDDNIVYIMAPKFPSYQFLNTVRDRNFRELRDIMLGFYSVNKFEIYPNAFVKTQDTVSNMIDIFNQVDYTSVTSGNRGYSEYINSWDFNHGTLEYYSLEENRLYQYLTSNHYYISSYVAPGFNTCFKGGNIFSDRCVVKGYKTVSLYDQQKSLEQNIYALLAEWIIGLKNRDLQSIADMLIRMSPLNGMKITAENRRVSIEGATDLLGVVANNFAKDRIGQAYIAYVDLPSDIYIYDEFCNVKPRKDWIALKDNSLKRGGIDEKRQAYADQAKCFIGLLQMYMDEIYATHKENKSNIIIQGLSPVRELAGPSAGLYNNFVTNQLVNLAIRKGEKAKFLINANICLASDFTKTLIRFQDYCYSLDNMKMSTNDYNTLKQSLIGNSVIRGNKIFNIASNYKDWYEEFKKNNVAYQKKMKELEAIERRKKQEEEALAAAAQERKGNAGAKEKLKKNKNLSDDLIIEMDENGEFDIKNGVVDIDEENTPTEEALDKETQAENQNASDNEEPEKIDIENVSPDLADVLPQVAHEKLQEEAAEAKTAE